MSTRAWTNLSRQNAIETYVGSMAPVPNPTQNINASATVVLASPSTSTSATLPPVRQPPGQPIILVFVLLVFILGCSTYFLCRNVRFKKIIISLSALGPTISALRASTRLVAAAPSKILCSRARNKENTAGKLDSRSNINASTPASLFSTSTLSDSELDSFKMGPTDIRVSSIGVVVGSNLDDYRAFCSQPRQ